MVLDLPVSVCSKISLVPVDEDALGRFDVVSGDGHRSAHVSEGVLHGPCKHNHDARTKTNSTTYKLRIIATAKNSNVYRVHTIEKHTHKKNSNK